MTKKMGRPRVEIDWQDFEKLCILQCSEIEIASFFGCSADTISRRVTEKYKVSFAELFKKYKGMGKVSLRRMQWQLAKKGSVQMLIFLGKQYLGQKDKIEASGAEVVRGPIVIIRRPKEEYEKARAASKARQEGGTKEIAEPLVAVQEALDD